MHCSKTTFIFKGNLNELLTKKYKKDIQVYYEIKRRVSIKDVLESFGIPHTEIGEIKVNNIFATFDYIVKGSDYVEVFPNIIPVDIFSPGFLRPDPLDDIRFVVDVNVGKLAGLLRLLGFDVLYKNSLDDEEIATISFIQRRIVLTRDKGLLKRKIIVFGHLIRESHPYKQLEEVVAFYDLNRYKKPFSRCMICNSILERIDKKLIQNRLEPLTNRFYNKFLICAGCKKIYWEGSHMANIEKNLLNNTKK